MDKYIYNYNEQNGLWYALRGDYYIPRLGNYPPKKKNGISAYGDNGICGISVSIKRLFTPVIKRLFTPVF